MFGKDKSLGFKVSPHGSVRPLTMAGDVDTSPKNWTREMLVFLVFDTSPVIGPFRGLKIRLFHIFRGAV